MTSTAQFEAPDVLGSLPGSPKVKIDTTSTPNIKINKKSAKLQQEMLNRRGNFLPNSPYANQDEEYGLDFEQLENDSSQVSGFRASNSKRKNTFTSDTTETHEKPEKRE